MHLRKSIITRFILGLTVITFYLLVGIYTLVFTADISLPGAVGQMMAVGIVFIVFGVLCAVMLFVWFWSHYRFLQMRRQMYTLVSTTGEYEIDSDAGYMKIIDSQGLAPRYFDVVLQPNQAGSKTSKELILTVTSDSVYGDSHERTLSVDTSSGNLSTHEQDKVRHVHAKAGSPLVQEILDMMKT